MRLIYLQRAVLFVFVFCTFFLPNCSEQQRSTLRPKPNAIGTPAQTLIVIEQELWDSPVGDSIRYNLGAAFPLLPAPEPILDMTNIKFEDMRDIKFQWKNIIFVGDLESQSETAQFIKKTIGEEAEASAAEDINYNYAAQNDRWAKNQQIAYIFANGKENLAKAVSQRAKVIIGKVYKNDKTMIQATTYSMGKAEGIITDLRADLLINLKVPGDYRIAFKNDDHFWLRKETRKVDMNLLIQKIPYTEGVAVDKENIIRIRNEFGKDYIASGTDNTYMSTDLTSLKPPVYFNQIAVNGNYTLEARGIWRMENGFMGGAFVSYLVYHEATQSLIFMDGFVYAPELSKRKYIQRLQVIMDSLEFLGTK
ncbi:MAG: hypothetical protein ACJAUH_001287 [Saprospiraceae bacterium]|jgi:hypothetical protein|tara:strand:+ start:1149 stop:2243 length:1095 start_codon:yes stop_codon:yes gene_type:complete